MKSTAAWTLPQRDLKHEEEDSIKYDAQ